MRIVYPLTVLSTEKKLAFLYRLQEVLRLKHNDEGKKYRNKEITKEQWETFLSGYFNFRSDVITSEILRIKTIVTESTKYTVNLTANFADD